MERGAVGVVLAATVSLLRVRSPWQVRSLRRSVGLLVVRERRRPRRPGRRPVLLEAFDLSMERGEGLLGLNESRAEPAGGILSNKGQDLQCLSE